MSDVDPKMPTEAAPAWTVDMLSLAIRAEAAARLGILDQPDGLIVTPADAYSSAAVYVERARACLKVWRKTGGLLPTPAGGLYDIGPFGNETTEQLLFQALRYIGVQAMAATDAPLLLADRRLRDARKRLRKAAKAERSK